MNTVVGIGSARYRTFRRVQPANHGVRRMRVDRRQTTYRFLYWNVKAEVGMITTPNM